MEIKQNPRGTSQENDDYTGLTGSLTVDSERDELRLHDGTTPGGHRILNLSQLYELFLTLDSELGAVQFSPEEKGFLTRIDDKTWALRGMQAGNGIELTNPFGTAGNTVIRVSADYVSGIAAGLLARRMYHFVTDGTPEALTISLAGYTPAWTFGTGVFFSVTFHATVANGATLKVGDLEPLPLRIANGSDNFHGAMKSGSNALIGLIGENWWVFGIQKAQDVPISAIAGLDGITDVQGALAALRAMVGTPGGGAVGDGFGAHTYGPLGPPNAGAHHADITNASHPIPAGKSRVLLRVRSQPADVNNNGWIERTLWHIMRIGDNYYQGRLSTLDTSLSSIGGNVVPDSEYFANEVIHAPARMQLIGTSFNFPRASSNHSYQITEVGTPVTL